MKKRMFIRQGGFTLIEFMAVLVLFGGIIGGVLYYKGKAGNNQKANSTVQAVSTMASKIGTYYQNEGTFAAVTPAAVNGMQLVAPPLTYDGTNVRDGWGNALSIAGGTTSFAISVGGATTPIDRETCTSIATQLASSADGVHVGTGVTTTDGAIGGGVVYKSVTTGTTSMANLTGASGCAATAPIVAAQFR